MIKIITLRIEGEENEKKIYKILSKFLDKKFKEYKLIVTGKNETIGME